MKLKEKGHFILQNLPFYLTGFFLIFCMKYYHSKAGVAELRWLLAPTAGWVSILSGIPFEYVQETGYVNHEMKMIIAASCSGMQFMLITAAMLIFSFVHLTGCRANAFSMPRTFTAVRMIRGYAWIFISFGLSCPFTIFVNGLRILAALYLPPILDKFEFTDRFLTPGQLHTAIGTVVYFISLLAIYRLTGCFFQTGKEKTILRKCLSPVFWYFSIVLGLPFLNRAQEKSAGQFTAFAVLVTVCCAAVLLPYCLAALVRRLRRHILIP